MRDGNKRRGGEEECLDGGVDEFRGRMLRGGRGETGREVVPLFPGGDGVNVMIEGQD